MSANRSRQAQKLAGLLTVHARTKVRLDYHDSVTARGRAWHIHWTDGPTWRQMLALAAGLAEQVPSLEVAQILPARAVTALAEAAAVLVWLDEDQTRADYMPAVWPQFAHDATNYPEGLSAVWRRRAEALLSLSGGSLLGSAALTALDDRYRTDGWAAALDWLDEIASGARRLRAV